MHGRMGLVYTCTFCSAPAPDTTLHADDEAETGEGDECHGVEARGEAVQGGEALVDLGHRLGRLGC